MANALKQHFPMIKDREEVLEEIHNKADLKRIFYGWTDSQRAEFLDVCTGVKGVKLLYDHFFKAVINPDTTPERLEELLSLILDTKVRILKVLPNDSTRIAAEHSFLVLDIVVELEDGSIANVEVQKLGYKFPGQRSACYSADLLLRQYKRVKGEKGKTFNYRDIKKVYTIVFFEQSTREFHKKKYKGNHIYIHRSKQETNTGLKMELLQEYVFIALDILRNKLDNIGIDIDNKLEAWLIFLSEDNPEHILELIEAYPEFKPLYEDVYRMCRNMEDIMGIFSEELAILDRNTAQLMIDEMAEELQNAKDDLQIAKAEMQAELESKKEELFSIQTELQSTQTELQSAQTELDTERAARLEAEKRLQEMTSLIDRLQNSIKKDI